MCCAPECKIRDLKVEKVLNDLQSSFHRLMRCLSVGECLVRLLQMSSDIWIRTQPTDLLYTIDCFNLVFSFIIFSVVAIRNYYLVHVHRHQLCGCSVPQAPNGKKIGDAQRPPATLVPAPGLAANQRVTGWRC